jgi:hypothetical protein
MQAQALDCSAGRKLIPIAIIVAATCLAQPSPEAKTREVLDLFLSRKYEAVHERFAPETKKALSLEVYKEQAKHLEALGAPKGIGEPKVTAAGDATVVTIPVKWEAVALDFGVRWNKEGQIAGIWFVKPAAAAWRPPAYSNPDSFTTREVTVGDDEWKLPGTFTLPKGKGPFPAVVLVHESGPHDRDETVGGVKVFAILRKDWDRRVSRRCAMRSGRACTECAWPATPS